MKTFKTAGHIRVFHGWAIRDDYWLNKNIMYLGPWIDPKEGGKYDLGIFIGGGYDKARLPLFRIMDATVDGPEPGSYNSGHLVEIKPNMVYKRYDDGFYPHRKELIDRAIALGLLPSHEELRVVSIEKLKHWHEK